MFSGNAPKSLFEEGDINERALEGMLQQHDMMWGRNYWIHEPREEKGVLVKGAEESEWMVGDEHSDVWTETHLFFEVLWNAVIEADRSSNTVGNS